MPRSTKPDAFEASEALPAAYHTDPRWKQVKKLRAVDNHWAANGLVATIRDDYGFKG